MFRDLAKCTASLKGERYDGAVISQVVWDNTPGVPTTRPLVLVDRHKMLRVQAADASGTLTIAMLLGRSAKLPSSTQPTATHLAGKIVAASLENLQLTTSFTSAAIVDFVTSVNDTNPLHQPSFISPPLVPALAIVERILLEFAAITRLELKFTAPSFAGDTIYIDLRSDDE